MIALSGVVTAGLAGLAVATTGASSGTAIAAVTCPAVDPNTGAVTPPPSAGVDWAGCDLTGAQLSGADLAGAQLQGATLKQADVVHANLANASLDNADLDSAVISGDLHGASFTMATLTGTFLTSSDLESADFTGVTGIGVKLIGSDLKNANLTNANLTSADLTSADLFGATLTGLTDDSVTWTHATCPNGASADFYTGGCLGTIAVTTPSATPTITTGTPGTNGWYTTPVTVSWFWIDSNDLTGNCPASTSSTGQGDPVVFSASCTDSAGHTATSQLSVDIDTTPPVEKFINFREGATYLLGESPLQPSCVTSDALSGVALNGGVFDSAGRPDGTGITTLTCSAAQDKAGNVAATITGHFTIIYEFGGFVAPKVGSTLKASAPQITVEFALANGLGTPAAAARQAGLGSHQGVRATLAGPGISPVVAGCDWNPAAKLFTCTIARPAGIKTGPQEHYTITASENVGSGFVTVPPDAFSENPEPVTFSSSAG